MSSAIRVLCVDDEPRVLEGLERNLGDVFDVVTAPGGARGVEVLSADPDFDVVISDMRMPEMNGATFLGHARRLAPDAARVLLTGAADTESARAAVNEGQIFRYLLKPCPISELTAVIETGAASRRRVVADRELLETTVSGSVKLLGEVMALAAPSCFRDTPAVTSIVEHMCERAGEREPWRFRAAAMLHGLGYVALPVALVEKRMARLELTPAEHRQLASAAEIGARLLADVPRFREVAEMVRRQHEPIADDLADDVARGAAMIQLALEVLEDVTPTRRIAQIARARAQGRTPAIRGLLERLFDFRARRPDEEVAMLKIAELRPGMALEDNLVTRAGALLCAKGSELSAPMLERIRQFHRTSPLAEPIKVRVG